MVKDSDCSIVLFSIISSSSSLSKGSSSFYALLGLSKLILLGDLPLIVVLKFSSSGDSKVTPPFS